VRVPPGADEREPDPGNVGGLVRGEAVGPIGVTGSGRPAVPERGGGGHHRRLHLPQRLPVLRPEIEQLTQTASETLQAAADRLGLTSEQRDKIAGIRSSHEDQFKALRAQRRSLLQEELKSINSILTPEQREKVKELAEDRMEQAEQDRTPGLPRFAVARATLAERVEAAADKLGLTSEQRKQIAQTLAAQAEQHSALKLKCRDAIEDEFKAIAAFLTPAQQEKAREAIERRVLRAAAASSIADRLEAGADKLGLNADQRRRIARANTQFAGKQRAMRSERRELLEEELKGIAAALTPEQRDKIKDFCEDQIVVVEVRTALRPGPGVDLPRRDTAEDQAAVKETIAERVEAMADKLGLTAEQRTTIRGVNAALADKFKSQRDQRRGLRAEEWKAFAEILTPEQREKAKDLVEDKS
jgi:Spy/CpxP family protein refolding chaperone